MSVFFRENDIRPAVFTEGKEAAKEKDLKYLVSKKTEFVRIKCPACGSIESKFAFEKYSFTFVSCIECETIYMNPRPTPEILRDFYANSALYDYWNRYIFPASKEVRREKIFKPRVKRILEICGRYNISKRCLVEVGAGFGIFCEEAKATGRFERVIAIEPGAALAESCRSSGIETIEDSIENIESLEIRPDVFVSFEVIEHLFSPEDFLQHCWRLMASDSIIAITCPNFKGFDIAALGSKSDSIDAEHINLFNPYSLTLLFKRSGLEVLECTTPGELDSEILRNKILAGEFDVSTQPFLKTVLIDRWDELGGSFQRFLQNNRLSSHMWFVGRKKRD